MDVKEYAQTGEEILRLFISKKELKMVAVGYDQPNPGRGSWQWVYSTYAHIVRAFVDSRDGKRIYECIDYEGFFLRWVDRHYKIKIFPQAVIR